MSQLAQRLFMASGGKKDSTYVDDVFSTYLYKGNGTLQTVTNGIKLTNNNQGSSVFMRDDGTGSTYIPATEDFKFGTGAFTIEFFIYFVYSTNYIAVFDGRTNSSNNNNDRTVTGLLANGQFNWWSLGAGGYVIPESAATQVPVRQWSHVAYVREGTGTNQAKMYINGSLVGTGTDNMDYSVNQPCRIGGHNWSPGVLYGSFSNYRVVKGTAVYTSNFTVPTKPLTAISGTVLLCFQSSTDPFAATVDPGGTWTSGTGSTPIAQSFGPFTANDGEGGMVWIKSRTNPSTGHYHHLVDTERAKIGGFRPALYSNTNEAQNTYTAATYGGISSLDNNGFSLDYGTNSDDFLNQQGYDYSSWTFRKQKGFFDVVTWTGDNDANRQIPHGLGSIPGCIMVKCTNQNQNWSVYHRGVNQGTNPEQYHMVLNETLDVDTTSDWNDTAPTSTHFTVSNGTRVNYVGYTYVAYVFAGGESTAATARSVDFDGSGDYLTQTCDAVLRNWWDQAFTVEYWVNADGFVSSGNGGPGVLGVCAPTSNGETWSFGPKSNGTVEFYYWNGSIQQVTTTKTLNLGQWYHLAMVYDGSSSIKIYINGILEKSATVQGTPTGSSTVFSIGKIANGSEFNGKVSNVRIAHQALYASSFRPPTKPLENITNTKLLCCNNSSVTGSTVTPATITAVGDPTASTQSPFDDPEGFKFGEGGDQNIIKCGSFVGNHTNLPEINLGFEPQFLLWKNADQSQDWFMLDSMRGIVTGDNDARLRPNRDYTENSSQDPFDLTSTGFKCTNNDNNTNGNGEHTIFIAIRRPDGLVGKPPEVGSDVFAMDVGNGSSNIPVFDSEFPVDFQFLAKPNTAGVGRYVATRLMGPKELITNTTQGDGAASNNTFDSNVGWRKGGSDSTFMSWMFKRHAGLDVIAYAGISATRSIPHNMGIAPEMMWIKNRTSGSQEWRVYHKLLNGGTNPQEWRLNLNDNNVESNIGAGGYWDVPTNTHITLHSNGSINFNSNNFIAMLFASVDGVSKVDGYIGDGESTKEIYLGFQPRFLIIRRTSNGGNWHVFDTLRGWTSGNDNQLALNNAAAQNNSYNYVGAPTSTGFSVSEPGGEMNMDGTQYIYYAHA